MRITNSMMVNQFLSDSNEALNRVAKYQSQVDSTKRISSISDDPQATMAALRANNKLSDLAVYQGNISTATSYLKEAESANDSLNEILKSVYDDIMSASAGTKSQTELDILAADIENLQEEVLNIANSTIGTSYIFGGYNFTGKTNGTTKTAPFSLSGTGDLLYNGINLSKLSWKEEFEKNVALMSDSDAAVTGNLDDTILDIANDFDPAYADDYAMDQAKLALDELNDFIYCGEAALEAAREFGIDPATSTEYQTFETFINDVKANRDLLSAECSKELDGSVPANNFNKTTVNTILDSISTQLGTNAAATAYGALKTEITNEWDTDFAADFASEAGKKTTIPIGIAQSADMTVNGIELLGAGDSNIYHLLGKAVSMLKSGDVKGLSGMITSVQNAQSNVLTTETKIGSMQNRMDLISGRYDKSELNYTEMQSLAEDVDMAEAIMNLKTAQTVYNAALAGGASIIQTSLIDFLS
jgi:flagellar hook-associated protein 3 FlgL